ncbi:hypothetical protein LEN26_010288 [Aphanomyces euteiches]|nr:hypothetical protein AeMF1_019718 [Aphanomyces euteiches]KAH9122346.1 hypothetical protein LEN26_010288 [Aphanomyces euteiches]KAH9186197.1 hypothetical protein AeNC1_011828 [Aphanomyces euteiches]
MWFGVNPLRWNRPTHAVTPRQPRMKQSRRVHLHPSAAKQDAISTAAPAPPTTTSNQATTIKPTTSSTKDNNELTQQDPPRTLPGPASTQTLFGHTAGVCALLASDDRYIISGSIDMTLRVWSRGSMHCYHVLRGHRDVVCAVALTRTYLLSASHDMTVGVWLAQQDFRLQRRLQGHTGHVTHVAFLPSDEHIAVTCSEDKTLRLWRVDVGLCTGVLATGHSSRVSCVLPLSSAIWSGGADATVCVWTLPVGHLLTSFRAHAKTVQSIVSFASDSIVATSSNDGRVQLYDAKALSLLRRLEFGTPLYWMDILRRSQDRVVVSSGDGRLLLIDATLGTSSEISVRRGRWLAHVALWDPWVACAAADDFVLIVDVRSGEIKAEMQIEGVHGVAWLNGTTLLLCGADGLIHAANFAI